MPTDPLDALRMEIERLNQKIERLEKKTPLGGVSFLGYVVGLVILAFCLVLVIGTCTGHLL